MFDWGFFFRKSVEKIQVSLKSGKNNRYCTWRPIRVYDLRHFFLEWEIFRTEVYRDNQNTRCVFDNFFPKIVPFMR